MNDLSSVGGEGEGGKGCSGEGVSLSQISHSPRITRSVLNVGSLGEGDIGKISEEEGEMGGGREGGRNK